MKIVYTYYLLTCVALCSIFSSCNNETDIYMENPDKRIQTKMQEYTDILTGAPDGWIAEINTQLGGIHTLWMQFTADNRVSMMFDYVEYYRDLKASPFESSYILKPLQGPTISFDTYSFLSIFADPNQLMNGCRTSRNRIRSRLRIRDYILQKRSVSPKRKKKTKWKLH